MNGESKTPDSKEVAPSAAEKLARLKAIVTHVGDQWGTVLHRQAYFHAMTRSTELADGLQGTYAAHVHNTVTDTFVIDLLREIGALVLDRDSNSASVAVAVRVLRDPLVLDELRKDYRIVLPSRSAERTGARGSSSSVRRFRGEKAGHREFSRVRSTLGSCYEDTRLHSRYRHRRIAPDCSEQERRPL